MSKRRLYATYDPASGPQYRQAQGSFVHCLIEAVKYWGNYKIVLKIKRIW